MKVNIDKYYLVEVYKLLAISIENINHHTVSFSYFREPLKYSVVEYSEDGNLIDLFSGEVYKHDIRYTDKSGVLFVPANTQMFPLNSIIKCNKQYMSKKKLIKHFREYVINLNTEKSKQKIK